MLAGLAREIEALDIPPSGDALIEALALAERLEAKLCRALGEADAAGIFGLDGAASAQAWVRHCTRRSSGEARRLVATARRLRSLAATAAAWEAGSLSSGQVQAVMANLSDATVGSPSTRSH